jgi:hypothetical protein
MATPARIGTQADRARFGRVEVEHAAELKFAHLRAEIRV